MDSIFVTGFPGYLASALLPRLLVRVPVETEFDCLVESRFEQAASRAVAALSDVDQCRIHLHPGDISRPDLQLGDALDVLSSRCRQIFHLAAIYDLAVRKEAAYRVNVNGTRHVLEFADRAGSLERFHFVSTCYVSGDYAGLFKETDLDVAQDFRNYYEETKFLSEQMVQENVANNSATTIYRPSIVGGDSRSGAAPKMDGLYYFIQWLLAQPRRLAVMPRIADTSLHAFNVVPSDFVVEAIDHLAGISESAGRVYQLCSPDPPSIRRLLELLAHATKRRVVDVPLPARPARRLLRSVCALHRRLDIPAEAIDYLAHPATYDCTNTARDLRGSGITCPDVAAYLPQMVDFVLEEWRNM